MDKAEGADPKLAWWWIPVLGIFVLLLWLVFTGVAVTDLASSGRG